ncbi:Serine/threonine-protein phosphatase 2B catalytic subunit A1 [Psilocybe cubensis]|uniref:Serine/threonine-protein phosphatase n=2 Tax=Psilocybe cubensis TaxID=181762 RepID=A0A8H7XL40_PSICU|nr:Serine/threonine-protein phosphatase 2B catalytic subunit A1 [Psilocybe cubensis]KAH9476265.1 Serine/threonine-protein phosphatase 2B catalytic subunit A1 [Psilocybe cubensis]
MSGSTNRHHHSGSFSGHTAGPTQQQPSASHHALESHEGKDFSKRPVPQVPPPATHKPSDHDFYVYDGGERKVNHEYLKKHFYREGRLTEAQALYIIEHVTNIFSREPNMVPLKSPVTICGDIHGQYYDLMKMFEVGGNLQDSLYLFLGDYVDRGDFGIECLLYLYALKISSPSRIVLLRGNHECRHLTEYFTFKRECLHKYSEKVYEACLRSFCALPISALVDGKFFCVHGGISPELIKLSDLDHINRFTEPGSHGLLCDLLWSDPIVNFGHENEPAPTGQGVTPGTTFMHNNTRGCSYFYTYEAVCQFLERNNLLTVIRGHEAQDAGYTMHRKTPKRNFPSVITIFSAPNYLDVYHNRGAILKYANKNITIRQYNSTAHPFWLPNFMDAFTWSLPFVGQKITEMLLAILSICSNDELAESDSDGEEAQAAPADLAARRQLIKNKILAVGRMQKVFQLLREEAENATELDGVTATSTAVSKPGADALSVQGARLNKSIRTFADARRSDMANERLPEFNEQQKPTIFPVPSMRNTSRRSSAEGLDMEDLIKRALEDDSVVDDGGVVEMLAEKIARGRSVTGRPGALKRHETT